MEETAALNVCLFDGVQCHFQQYFSYIEVEAFKAEGPSWQ
jgi:hypothetical protein